MKRNKTIKEKNITPNNEPVNMAKGIKETDKSITKQDICEGFKTQTAKDKIKGLKEIREEALKLIPEEFGEKELRRLTEISSKLAKLPLEERRQLLEDLDNISREELIERLEGRGKSNRQD